MGKYEDLTGRKFGRLTVIKRIEEGKDKGKWECKCDCGNMTRVWLGNLKNGQTKSCGCYQKEIQSNLHKIHGEYNTRLYEVWRGIVKRCTKEYDKDYKNYGARGITVCSEWLDYKTFSDWAKANGYEKGLTIDRINNEKGYSPENCIWTDRTTQNRNKRNNVVFEVNGISQCMSAWSEMLPITYGALKSYYRRNGKVATERRIAQDLERVRRTEKQGRAI